MITFKYIYHYFTNDDTHKTSVFKSILISFVSIYLNFPSPIHVLLFVVTIAVVNCIDTTLAARMQVFFTGAKLIALMIIVVGGLIRLGQGKKFYIDIRRCGLCANETTLHPSISKKVNHYSRSKYGLNTEPWLTASYKHKK